MADREKERLEELGREIDDARSQAQAHDTIPDPDHEERFYETPQEQAAPDDETTTPAPPG